MVYDPKEVARIVRSEWPGGGKYCDGCGKPFPKPNEPSRTPQYCTADCMIASHPEKRRPLPT